LSLSLTHKALLANLFLLLFLSATSKLIAQDAWVEYVLIKDKGVMSVSLDLNLDLLKPNYKNLLVVGTKYTKCLKNGFPTEDGLNDIYRFSDSISVAVDKITLNRLAGFITYQCMAFDVFYVKDTIGLRDEIKQLVKENFIPERTYVEIKRDKPWEYYSNYLYPRDFSSEFLIDQNYLHDLVLQGDDLQGIRKVNHWVYFKTLEKRNLFGSKLKKLKFSLDSIAYKKDRIFPYELTVSRQDSIDPVSIYNLTSMLRLLSETMNAKYDGWSTEVKIKD